MYCLFLQWRDAFHVLLLDYYSVRLRKTIGQEGGGKYCRLANLILFKNGIFHRNCYSQENMNDANHKCFAFLWVWVQQVSKNLTSVLSSECGPPAVSSVGSESHQVEHLMIFVTIIYTFSVYLVFLIFYTGIATETSSLRNRE